MGWGRRCGIGGRVEGMGQRGSGEAEDACGAEVRGGGGQKV